MVDNRNNLRAAVDRAKLTIRLSVIGGCLSLLLLVLVVALGMIKDSFAGSDVFALSALPFSASVLFSIASLIYGMLANAAAIEDEEKYLLEARKENRALNVEEDVRFTAGRSFENYRKYAPYVVTVIAALGTALYLFLYYRYWTTRLGGRPLPVNSLNAALVSAILMLLAIFSGAFFVGQSRTPAFRWLRPIGSWLVAAAAVLFGATISSICNHYQLPLVDTKIAWVLFWILAILGAEFVLNFIIEFYRPRTLEEPRPIFESRLLALFTEPGGVMRNMADALDYQFGFKVSGTWIYGFVERSLFPLAVVWLLVFWLSTSIYEVGPAEIGIRERFGRVVSTEPLKSGVYFELPWPFGGINRFSCTRVHEVVIGARSGVAAETGKANKRPEVILWTKSHMDNENEFIVAVKPEGNLKQEHLAANIREAVSIAFIGMAMPVMYRIREAEIMNYAYGNRDPELILKRLSEEIATEYFASCSLMHIMSDGRHEAADAMRDRIQRRADQEKLGIEIVAVNLLDVHPPVEKVAPAFQEVIGAMEKKEAAVLEAKAYEAKIVPEARSLATEIEQTARSYRYRTAKVAEAEGMRFSKQLTSYRAMPEMFKLNARLSLLEKDAADVRKFILSASLQNEIYELNFEQKERLDLVDADLNTLVNK